jgi:hypothetical protein
MKSYKCQKNTLSHKCLKAATYVPQLRKISWGFLIVLISPKDFDINLLFMFPMSFLWWQTHKADTKGWKKLEGRREDERKIKII